MNFNIFGRKKDAAPTDSKNTTEADGIIQPAAEVQPVDQPGVEATEASNESVATSETSAEQAPESPENTVPEAAVVEALGHSAAAFEEASTAVAEGNGDKVEPAAVDPSIEAALQGGSRTSPEVPENTAPTEETPVETFTVPQVIEEAPVSDQAVAEGIATPQEVVTTPEITIHPVLDAAPAEGTDDTWAKFDATEPNKNADVVAPGETQQ